MQLLTANEVCYLVGISIYTLNNWYAFKRAEPDNEYAKLLPEFRTKSTGSRVTRYWTQEDVAKLITFRSSIPWGKGGVMGKITQKYVKKGDKNGTNQD